MTNKTNLNFEIIAGPCSAESEKQLFDIAENLSIKNNVDIFRAGIWKPRTKPGTFEGVGNVGVEWLKNIQKKYNLPCAVEIANVNHLEICLKNDINIFWLGARTTVNPFLVEEIAKNLKNNSNVRLFIKNPITPDLKLWLGAIERCEKYGIKNIACIHRGFYNYYASEYRNTPLWEIPIQLKIIRPDIKLFCDPSHITGDRNLIYKISQKAIDLEMDGLMIEVHNNPSIAKSDAEQQITEHEFDILIEKLIFKQKGTIKHKIIDDYRMAIDDIDSQIINLFAQRLSLVKQIGNYKNEKNINILQSSRWQEVRKNIIDNAKKNNIDINFIYSYLDILHNLMLEEQNKI